MPLPFLFGNEVLFFVLKRYLTKVNNMLNYFFDAAQLDFYLK